MGSRAYVFGLLVFFAAVIGGCARVEVKPPPTPVAAPEGRYTGSLLLDNAVSLSPSGAVVSTETERAVADEKGRFAFEKMAPGKHLVVAEKRSGTGPVKRLLGVTTVFVEEGPVEMRIRMRDATEVDAFCLECHPPLKQVTRRDQIARDIHPSGIVPRKAKKPTGRFDEKGRVTCESCHSIHRDTGHPHFALTSYTDGKMCQECHGR